MSAVPPSNSGFSNVQRREAAEWFVIIHGEDDPKAESIQAWLRWMEQHEGNRAAFDAVALAWHATPGSSALAVPNAAEIGTDAYNADQSVQEWLEQQPAPTAMAFRHSRPTAPRVSRRAWLAGAGAVLAVASVLGLHRNLNSRDPSADVFTTKIGEQIEITLADGSHVWLGPKSKLLVAFTKMTRGIQLETGEAFFSVKKDPTRPFTVRSDSGDIVAVGTAFNVRAIDQRVTVAVSEGVITVMPKAQLAVANSASVRVAMGQQVTFTAQQTPKALAIIESPPGERARWRDGVLVYRDESLREVVSDVVRYSDVQIEITDAAVGELRYSGVIYQDAVHEWISALPESFPVIVESDGAREIIKAR